MVNHDLYKEVSDKFIAMLEQGGIQSWHKAWKNISSVPVNAITGTKYRGWNWFSLTLASGKRPNQWATFKQVQSQKGRIRKGACGAKIGFYEYREIKSSNFEAQESVVNEEKQFKPIFRVFHVFNILDIEDVEFFTPTPFEGDAIESVMTCLSKLQSDGLSYKRVGNVAGFWPLRDLITMPQGDFNSIEDFCAVLSHEMVHATGPRLGRSAKIHEWYSDADDAYAMEELVAEMGAAFICANLNIKGNYDNHVGYLDNWLKILKGDKFTLYRAVKLAQEAADWLLDNKFSAPPPDAEDMTVVTNP